MSHEETVGCSHLSINKLSIMGEFARENTLTTSSPVIIDDSLSSPLEIMLE